MTSAQHTPLHGGTPAMHPRDFTLVVFAGTLWGTGGLAGALLSQSSHLSWLAIASLRLTVGGLALLAVAAATGTLRRVPRTRAVAKRICVTAALSALYQAAYLVAVGMTSVSLATVVALASAPVLVAVAGAVRSRRAPATVVSVAIALALLGLVLLVGVPSGAAGSNVLLGTCLALVSGAAFAATTAVNRTPVPGLHAIGLTGPAFTLAGLALLPLGLAAGFELGATWPAMAFVLYLGLGPTAIAYTAYYTGLRTVPATTATVVALLEPVTAAVCAAVVLDERLGWAGAAGVALLIVAVVLLRPRRAVPAPGADGEVPRAG